MANSRDIDWPTRLAEAQTVVQTHLDRTPLVRVDLGGFDAPDVPQAGVAAADRVVQGARGAGRRGHGGARRSPGGDGLRREPRPRCRVRRDAAERSSHGGRPGERLDGQGRGVAPLRHRSAAGRGQLRRGGAGCAQHRGADERRVHLRVHAPGRHRRTGHRGRRSRRTGRRPVPHRRAGRWRWTRSRDCARCSRTGQCHRRRGAGVARRVRVHARRACHRRRRRVPRSRTAWPATSPPTRSPPDPEPARCPMSRLPTRPRSARPCANSR